MRFYDVLLISVATSAVSLEPLKTAILKQVKEFGVAFILESERRESLCESRAVVVL